MPVLRNGPYHCVDGGLEPVNSLRQSNAKLRQKHPTGAIHGKAQFDPARSRPRLEVIAGDRDWQGKHLEPVEVVLAADSLLLIASGLPAKERRAEGAWRSMVMSRASPMDDIVSRSKSNI